MSLILNIDTAVQGASICLAKDESILSTKTNPDQKDSASWLHPAIKEMLEQVSVSRHQLDAIAISAGPGSYTGLRVGMAAAKGLCFALNIPLITLNTLKIMAAAARGDEGNLLAPMIDARRMEVFTALYDQQLEEISPATNIVLDEGSFNDKLQENRVLFFGNGSNKFQTILSHPNASFRNIGFTANDMVPLSLQAFAEKKFADLAYSAPFYGKEFYTPPARQNM